uniref:Uncharacterized protein n=1 Tax=Acrobeloides nanus TaxID=290746 RepID=A0A914CZG9_9BILA
MMKVEFALILCFCIFIVHGSLFQSPIQLYNAMKVIARKATTTKPALFKNCASDSTWHSIILSAEQTNLKDRRYFVRKVAESVLEKYGNESMFIAAYNEYNRNISIFVQADGNMAEWGTVFSNLEKFSFGCLHSSNGEETGLYVVKRPSEDDLSKVSTQKLMAFSRMIGNQQGM